MRFLLNTTLKKHLSIHYFDLTFKPPSTRLTFLLTDLSPFNINGRCFMERKIFFDIYNDVDSEHLERYIDLIGIKYYTSLTFYIRIYVL